MRTDGNGLGKRRVSTPCAFRSHAYEDEKPRGYEMDMAWDDLDEEDMTEPETVFDTRSTMTTTTRDVATSFSLTLIRSQSQLDYLVSWKNENGASFEGCSLRAAPTNA